MAASPVNIYGDVINNVLNIARSRVNDLILAPGGYPGGGEAGMQFTEAGGGSNLSTDLNPDGSLILRTQVIFNSAWRKFQKYLANLGYRLLIGDNLIITALPVNNNPDPAAQSWLSWNGFFNGTTFASTPALPQDFYAPLKIRERITGQNSLFFPMTCALDGLRNQFIRTVLNRQWEWRTNALYLPGATSITDLQFRYVRYLPDYPDQNYYIANTPWYLQKLPIPGCASALAWYVAYEATFPGDEQTGQESQAANPGMAMTMLQNAENEANLVFNDQARADQRTNNRRRPRGGPSGSNRGYR